MTNPYEQLTKMMVDMVDSAGKWSPPWQRSELTCHHNAATKRRYRGMNVLMLWLTEEIKGYDYPVWATFKQWQSMKCQVKKGEKGTPVVFYDKYKRQVNGGEDEVAYTIAKTHYVFNASQVNGYEPPKAEPASHNKIMDCEAFLKNSKARIEIHGERAYYHPEQDKIVMPDIGLFKTPEHYYSTAFHELTHWTGAGHRLNRELKGIGFRSEYAFEELVAELGASFLAAEFGILNVTKEENASYLRGWRDAMKKDNKIIFNAASLATKAVEYLVIMDQMEDEREVA